MKPNSDSAARFDAREVPEGSRAAGPEGHRTGAYFVREDGKRSATKQMAEIAGGRFSENNLTIRSRRP